MGNYNSQQLFRRYPNKLGKYAIHCGRKTSEVKYPILAKAETPFAIIKSQAETSQKIGVTTYTANKASSRIYNKKDIRKGRNSSITIILPISIGKHPQFFTSFDFIIKKAN